MRKQCVIFFNGSEVRFFLIINYSIPLSTSLNKFRDLTSPVDFYIYHAFGLVAQNALIESVKERFPRVQRTRKLARS
jgi:hypothetical protein